jgi:hypothetical protein
VELRLPIVVGFLKRLEALWPGSTKTIQVIRDHNDYLEDQGYTDIILENLDDNQRREDGDVGDGIIWDPDPGGEQHLETD